MHLRNSIILPPVPNKWLYYGNVFIRQQPFIKSIIKRFNLTGKTVLSLASGLCAEESIFALAGTQHVDCVDPFFEDAVVGWGNLEVAKEMTQHIPNLDIIQQTIQNFQPEHKYDFVYCSSPADWMEEYGWEKGMPPAYADILNRCATDCAIFMIYVGKFHERSFYNNEKLFVSTLGSQMATIGFTLIEYWHFWANAQCEILVLSRNPREIPYDVGFETSCRRWRVDANDNTRGRRLYQWTEQSKDSSIVWN